MQSNSFLIPQLLPLLISITAIHIFILILDFYTSGQNGAGENQPLLSVRVEMLLHLLLRYFCYHLPYLSPSSPVWSQAATAWAFGMWGACQIEFRYLCEVWGKLRRIQFYKLLQWCCLSLPVCWLTLTVLPSGSCHNPWVLLASGLGRERIIITITHNKIFALRLAPLLSEPVRLRPMWWLNRTQVKTSSQGLWWSSKDHPRNNTNCFSFAKMNRIKKGL